MTAPPDPSSVPQASSLPLAHRLWRLFPARERRLLLARAASWLAPSIDPAPPPASQGVAVAGELSRPSGLGEGARLMLAALDGLGVPGWAFDVGGALPAGGPAAGGTAASGSVAVAPPGVPLVLHVNAPLLPHVLRRLPRALVRGRRVIGYWAWELPAASPEWRFAARFVHEVWTPSRFSAGALQALAPGRVRVVPHPLAAVPPVASALGRPAFGLPDAAVVVLVSFNLASSFERKNPLGAIAAFRAAFGDRPDRLLVLKVGHPGHFPADFARLRAAAAGAANIRIDMAEMPQADSHALTRAADIVLSLHRSEGFGLIPAEAMLLGVPVVATGWSGNMDFMDDESAALVPYRLVPARDPRGVFEAPGAVWAEPDLGAAAAALRRLADDPAGRIALGARGRAMATARLGAESLAEALRGIGLTVPV